MICVLERSFLVQGGGRLEVKGAGGRETVRSPYSSLAGRSWKSSLRQWQWERGDVGGMSDPLKSESAGRLNMGDKRKQNIEASFQVSGLGDRMGGNVAIHSSGDYGRESIWPAEAHGARAHSWEAYGHLQGELNKAAVPGAQCGVSTAFMGSPDSGICKACSESSESSHCPPFLCETSGKSAQGCFCSKSAYTEHCGNNWTYNGQPWH